MRYLREGPEKHCSQEVLCFYWVTFWSRRPFSKILALVALNLLIQDFFCPVCVLFVSLLVLPFRWNVLNKTWHMNNSFQQLFIRRFGSWSYLKFFKGFSDRLTPKKVFCFWNVRSSVISCVACFSWGSGLFSFCFSFAHLIAQFFPWTFFAMILLQREFTIHNRPDYFVTSAEKKMPLCRSFFVCFFILLFFEVSGSSTEVFSISTHISVFIIPIDLFQKHTGLHFGCEKFQSLFNFTVFFNSKQQKSRDYLLIKRWFCSSSAYQQCLAVF